jgi:hypothetical protein
MTLAKAFMILRGQPQSKHGRTGNSWQRNVWQGNNPESASSHSSANNSPAKHFSDFSSCPVHARFGCGNASPRPLREKSGFPS